jgi:hypothetical protein
MDSPTHTKGQAMTNQAKFLLPGAEVVIKERRYNHNDKRGYSVAPRMYVWADETFNIAEDMMNRTRRPHTEWKKIIKPLFASYLPQVSLEKFSWSQYAGCTCPCSPGFILGKQSVLLEDGRVFWPFDIHVTLKGAPTVDESKPGRLVTV